MPVCNSPEVERERTGEGLGCRGEKGWNIPIRQRAIPEACHHGLLLALNAQTRLGEPPLRQLPPGIRVKEALGYGDGAEPADLLGAEEGRRRESPGGVEGQEREGAEGSTPDRDRDEHRGHDPCSLVALPRGVARHTALDQAVRDRAVKLRSAGGDDAPQSAAFGVARGRFGRLRQRTQRIGVDRGDRLPEEGSIGLQERNNADVGQPGTASRARLRSVARESTVAVITSPTWPRKSSRRRSAPRSGGSPGSGNGSAVTTGSTDIATGMLPESQPQAGNGQRCMNRSSSDRIRPDKPFICRVSRFSLGPAPMDTRGGNHDHVPRQQGTPTPGRRATRPPG